MYQVYRGTLHGRRSPTLSESSLWHVCVVCAQSKLKVPVKKSNLVAAGGHVDTFHGPRGQLKRTRLGPCQQQSARWRHSHCSHLLPRPPRDAATAPPISTDLLSCAAVADRSRFDAIILFDGCPVRIQRALACRSNPTTALTIFRTPVWQTAAAAWPATSTWNGESVRAHSSSWTKHGGRPAWWSHHARSDATVGVRLVDARKASGRSQQRACCVTYPTVVNGRRASWPGHHVWRDTELWRCALNHPSDVPACVSIVCVRLGDCGRSLRPLLVKAAHTKLLFSVLMLVRDYNMRGSVSRCSEADELHQSVNTFLPTPVCGPPKR